MKNETIEFECISKRDNEVKFAGYVYADDLDADVTDIYFYDECGLEAGNYVPKPHCQEGSSEFEAYYDVVEAWKVDDLFLQFLSDYSDEDRTVDRGEYFLQINDGAKMELEITSASDYPNMEGCNQYIARVIPKFNGKNILKEYSAPSFWHETWTPLFKEVQKQYELEEGFVEDGAFWMEIPSACFEWSSEYNKEIKAEIITEYTDECTNMFVQVLTSELGVYSISETLEQEMEACPNEWDMYLMTYFIENDEDFEKYLVEQGYEFLGGL